MRIGKFILRDKFGWPVETVQGRPVHNFFRLTFKTNLKQTWQRRVANDTKKFTITVEMQDRWIPHFMSMLKYMEECGSVGRSRMVAFYADGDGDFRPKFSANTDYEVVKPFNDKGGNRTYDAG